MGGQWSDLDLCISEERATLRENSPSYVNNLERERVWVGKKTRKTRDRSRINETISKNRGKGEARDKKKGAGRKERGENTSGWRREEKAGQRSEWVQRQATTARRKPGCCLR